MKSKCFEFQLKKFIRILTTGNGVPPQLQEGPRNNFGHYRKLLYNYHDLSEDQVTALSWYSWGGNDVHCVKLDPLVTLPLNFSVVDPEVQRAKEKQNLAFAPR